MAIWTLADVTRYAFYAAKIVLDDANVLVSILGNIRYNIFVVLYPAGLVVECTLHYYRMLMAGEEKGLLNVYDNPGFFFHKYL